jgi:UDP-3-O-[3-hydroxymyristoyl] glucosamine N-acyltransferase
MRMTLKEIAHLVGAEIVGDPETAVDGLSTLDHPAPGTLVWIARKELLKKAEDSSAAAVLADRSVESCRKPLLRAADPRLAMARIAAVFSPPRRFAPGVSPRAAVSPSARLGKEVTVQAHAVIEDGASVGDRSVIGAGAFIGLNSTVGADTRIYPNVTVNENVVVGDRCIIHAGTVLGGDGFGYVPDEEGRQVKIPQSGRVVIEDDVEIGCNTAVDRGTFGDTVIRKGVKIDNLVQIAHNDDIGENTVICGQVAVAGSVKIGKNVILAGQAGIADHAELGDGVIIAAQSGVAPHKKVKPKQILLGSPGRPFEEAKMLMVLESRRLKEMMKNRPKGEEK